MKQMTSLPKKQGFLITAKTDAPLSKAQIEFNKLMKRLEKTQEEHEKEITILDQSQVIVLRDMIPLLEKQNRLERDLVFAASKTVGTIKFTAKRRESLEDLISNKAFALLEDPLGLSEEDIDLLEKITEDLSSSEDQELQEELEKAAFDFLRDMLEGKAREAGLDLDLSDLDHTADPKELERMMHERLGAAAETFKDSAAKKPGRKKTKAQLEKERRLQEQEEVKKRDIKSLYKQLAKALHPDLEADPTLKAHRETWMKRLTSAYQSNDLRDMLQIEMEWLGEESSNLKSASDEKLRVYSAVIKEQIADLKDRTRMLIMEPQYEYLRRFTEPYRPRLANSERIRGSLLHEIDNLSHMLKVVADGGPECRKMMNQWADTNTRNSKIPPFPF